MADRKRLFFILLVLVPVMPPLFGQEGEVSSFHIERTEAGERFIQRLLWDKADYAYRYEVRIEEQNGDGVYTEMLRESGEENFIELSLAPGSYRYRIRAYNILNRPSENSAWIYFRILPALQPELYSFTQGFSRNDRGSSEELTEIILQGRNLQEGADVYLASPETDASPTRPLDYLPLEEGARLIFNTESLPPGRYRVYVRNPGGLESSLEITVAPPPPSIADTPDAVPDAGAPPGDTSDDAVTDTVIPSGDADTVPGGFGSWSPFVSAEYAPPIPLYGYLFEHFDRNFYPLGASFRFGVLPFKKNWGDLGLEAAPHWTMLKTDFEGVRQTAHLAALHLNGIYQRWFPNQTTALTFRLGGGISFVYGINENPQSSESILTWMPSVSGGLSFKWFVYKLLYIEIGAEYTHVFSAEPSPGYIKPFLGAGRRFGPS
ncbi:MAG: hypothetical protein LBJ24_08850 [Treponema sp.]|jgi:hypothetical protein|nr:hypothetical protein [Treponema sp.]